MELEDHRVNVKFGIEDSKANVSSEKSGIKDEGMQGRHACGWTRSRLFRLNLYLQFDRPEEN